MVGFKFSSEPKPNRLIITLSKLTQISGIRKMHIIYRILVTTDGIEPISLYGPLWSQIWSQIASVANCHHDLVITINYRVDSIPAKWWNCFDDFFELDTLNNAICLDMIEVLIVSTFHSNDSETKYETLHLNQWKHECYHMIRSVN